MANLDEPPNSKKIMLRRSVRNLNRDRKMLLRQNPPELCMEAIYRHIPLERLLLGSTQLISKSWHAARTRALAERKTLYLFICDEDVNDVRDVIPYKYRRFDKYIKREDGSPYFNQAPLDELEFDSVHLPTERLTVKFTSFLLNSLPKITNLAILAKSSGSVNTGEVVQMIRLLEHHSVHLKKLHLSLSNMYEQQIAPQAITRLFEALNRLTVLDHLKLNIFFSGENERPPLTILSRLTSFSIDSNLTLGDVVNGEDWLSSSLRNYADSSRVGSIGVEGLELSQLAQLDPELVGKFNWLHVPGEQIESAQMIQLFARFNSLTYLELSYGLSFLPINTLVRYLAQVPSLVFLKLLIYEVSVEPRRNEGEPVIRYQVPSILALSMRITVESHEDVEDLHIADTFPRLQVIVIEHYVEKCSSCPFKRKMATFERVSNCRRLARDRMLAGCHNLHMMIIESDDPQCAGYYHHVKI